MRLRAAGPGDLDALAALERYFPSDRLSRARFRYLLRRGHADIRVCEIDGLPVADAVSLYRRGTKIARLYSLVVHPGHQRRGIARRLLQAAEAAAAARGCRELRLEVRPDNTSAIRFYRNSGYRLAGRIADYYEDGTEALRMSKRLDAPAEFSAPARPPRRPAAGALCSTSSIPAAAPESRRKSGVA